MASQKLELTIKIKGFSNDNGKAFLEVLNDENKVIKQLVVPIKNKGVSLQIELPKAGKYAVKAFHDENNNKKLDTNLVGYPTEKWGVSNGVRPAFRAPKLEEMLIEISNSSTIDIKLQ